MNLQSFIKQHNPYRPLRDLMALYERNYSWLQRIFPYDQAHQHWVLKGGVEEQPWEIHCEHLPLGPYTSELILQQQIEVSPWLMFPHMKIRLFHDARMAEVQEYNRKAVKQLIYPQPNPAFQRYEKEAINRFLGEWLKTAETQGYERLSLPPYDPLANTPSSEQDKKATE